MTPEAKAAITSRALERAERARLLCSRAKASTEPYDGTRFRVVRGAWSDRPHRVYDKRLRAIRGDFKELSEANAHAAAFDAELASPPKRVRAYAALAAAALFAVTATTILRRALP